MNMRLFRLTLLALVLPFSAARAEPQLTVTAIDPVEGQLLVRIYDTRIGYDTKSPLRDIPVPVTAPTMTVALPEMVSGIYAISVYHDINRNGELDRSGIGIPREPIGYSMNPAVRMGRPTFAQTQFTTDTGFPDLTVQMTQPPEFKANWGLGAGAVYSTSPYRDGDNALSPIPFVVYIGDRLAVFGPMASFVAFRTEVTDFRILADYRFGGDVFEESTFLADMDKRENTLMAGAGLSYEAPFNLDLDLGLKTDVLGRHEGQIASLDIDYSYARPKLRLSCGAGLTWNSDRYTAYYYGVGANEARPGRPAYDPGDALIPNLSAGISWAPIDNWQAVLFTTYEWLPAEITDSPIIAKDYQISIVTGLSYLF